MHRAFLGNLQQAVALLGTQRSDEPQRSLNTVHQGVLIFTIGAVAVVDPFMTKAHLRALERPTLARGIHLYGHGRASPEGHEQQLIGRGAGVAAANSSRLIRREHMPAVEESLFEGTSARRNDQHAARRDLAWKGTPITDRGTSDTGHLSNRGFLETSS
jgi:hypothetical protein